MASISRMTGAFAIAITIAATSVVVAQQPPAQQPTFKGGTQVVSLFATVQDAQKRLVPDLTK